MKILNRFKMNLIPIVKLTLSTGGTFFTILTVLLSFISFEEMGINNIWIKIAILGLIVVVSFTLALILILFVFRRNRIWKKGKNSVTACYGDLIDYAFNSKYKDSRIIVVPVNDTFDTKVEEPNEKTDKPLVSPKTLHGIWIRNYCSCFKISEEDLNNKIQQSLKTHGITGKTINRSRGNNIKYHLGDVAIIDGPNNAVFYLLAISTFDKNNNAHIEKKELRNCIEQLLDFYDKTGQSIPIYIPLIGTGSSRAGLTHESSLKIIKSCVLTSEEKINGSVNIIVYNKDKNKVSIFK